MATNSGRSQPFISLQKPTGILPRSGPHSLILPLLFRPQKSPIFLCPPVRVSLVLFLLPPPSPATRLPFRPPSPRASNTMVTSFETKLLIIGAVIAYVVAKRWFSQRGSDVGRIKKPVSAPPNVMQGGGVMPLCSRFDWTDPLDRFRLMPIGSGDTNTKLGTLRTVNSISKTLNSWVRHSP